jgi:hypothetical protein
MIITSSSIETVSGRYVDVANPNPADIGAEDIAWALSREPRFSGHTIHALPYTVGQHSMVVANIVVEMFKPGTLREAALQYFHEMRLTGNFANVAYQTIEDTEVCPRALALAALLHDASEAYLRDIPSPVKSIPGLKEAYAAIESKMMDCISEKFGVTEDLSDIGMSPGTEHAIIHWADVYARTIEAYHLMPSRGSPWPSGAKFKLSLVELQQFKEPEPSLKVYQDFLVHLDSLTR